jgi:two-component system, NtrC family, response regulator HydG
MGGLRERVPTAPSEALIGDSRPMRELRRRIERVAQSRAGVLIQGESGTGKELVARAVHEASDRAGGPFVAVNCAAIPEALIESELFGHERGSFTGAHQKRLGRFELAHGGTLFLDEIGELRVEMQAKLLRALQERSFTRVGGDREVAVDFRVLSATHRDLAADVVAGRFREDLFFRLAVIEIDVPALRERGDDVLALARHFLTRHLPEDVCELTADAIEALRRHRFPGNVRELENAIHHAAVMACGPRIELDDLPPRIANAPIPTSLEEDDLVLGGSLESLERRAIASALSASGGNVTEVGRRLGLGRTTLYRKLRKYGLR